MTQASPKSHPLLALSPEDLEFVTRLVLASGSLKDVAQAYGISYPTVRARLDQLIGRLNTLMNGRPPDPMADMLADLIAKGEVTAQAARGILDSHRKEIKKLKENAP